MPLTIRRPKVETTLSTPGKSRGGNGPNIAKACQRIATVRNGAAAPAADASAWRRVVETPRRYKALADRLRLRQQIPVERAAQVGDRLDPALDRAGHQLLRLILQVGLDRRRDIRLPPHPAKRLVDDRDGHLAAERFLLVGVHGGRLLGLVLEE